MAAAAHMPRFPSETNMFAVAAVILLATSVAGWEYRLHGSSSAWAGILQARPTSGDAWGTVCPDGMSYREARAACRSAGVDATYVNAQTTTWSNADVYYIKDVVCARGTTDLSTCTMTSNAASVSGCSVTSDFKAVCDNQNGYGVLDATATEAACAAPEANKYCADNLVVTVNDTHVTVDENDYDCHFTYAHSGGTATAADLGPTSTNYEFHAGSTCTSIMSSPVFATTLAGSPATLSLTGRIRGTKATPSLSNMQVRIDGGGVVGRLEVQTSVGQDWGSVCSTGNTVANQFDFFDGLAACHSAGIVNATSVKLSLTTTSPLSKQMGNVKCPVDYSLSSSLDSCPFAYAYDASVLLGCGANEVVNIDCTQPPAMSEWEFQIEGGGTRGRLQVRPSSLDVWGTACFFENNDVALAACRSAGHTEVTRPTYYTASGGTGQGFIYGPKCPPGNSSITFADCVFTYNPEGTATCTHSNDVGIDCTPQPAWSGWEFALNNTDSTGLLGRLDVRPGSGYEWGTVCHTEFDESHAMAACHSLGYSPSHALVLVYPQVDWGGTGPVYINKPVCPSGAGVSLSDCSIEYSEQNPSSPSCAHSFTDVGISCAGLPALGDWAVRLYTFGSDPWKGYLQVTPSHNMSGYGAVGPAGFSYNAAIAGCRSAGFDVHYADFNTGILGDQNPGGGVTTEAPVFMDNIVCPPGEHVTFANCTYDFLSSMKVLVHTSEIALTCNGQGFADINVATSASGSCPTTVPSPTGTDFAGSYCDANGQALVTVDSTLITVELSYLNCTFHYSHGLSAGATGDLSMSPGGNSITIETGSTCGAVTDVTAQRTGGILTVTARAQRTQVVTPMVPYPMEFKIDGGGLSGILKVKPQGRDNWGTVCSEGWTFGDAIAACRSLGHVDAVTASWSATSGATGSIFMRETGCSTAPDQHLQQCPFVIGRLAVHGTCTHVDDAAVDCTQPAPMSGWEYAIEGGGSHGRLTVRPTSGDAWGTVCGNGFTTFLAAAACRALGFNRTNPVFGESAGAGPIYMSDTVCVGTNISLRDCLFVYSESTTTVGTCAHANDIAIDCTAPPPMSEWEFSLNNTEGRPEHGRLEVRPGPGYEWGTVCDASFTNDDAMAACRQVGFSSPQGITATVLTIPDGPGPAYMSDVQCGPTDNELSNCSFKYAATSIMPSGCSHAQDIGLECSVPPPIENWEFSIEGGLDYGLLRVRPNSTAPWGTVCRDGASASSFDLDDAHAVCRSLGYSGPHVYAAFEFTSAGAGSGPMYVSHVACPPRGENASLANCTFTYFTTESHGTCSHSSSDDVVITCSQPPPMEHWEFRVNPPTGGRIEARPSQDHEWGAMCPHVTGSTYSAYNAICHNAGYWSDVGSAAYTAIQTYGVIADMSVNESAVYIDYLDCSSNGVVLVSDCVFRYSNSSATGTCTQNSQHQGVTCSLSPPPRGLGGGDNYWEVAIEGGGSSGRLNVRPGHWMPWGNLCNDTFTLGNTQDKVLAACRSAGFPLANASSSFFTVSDGPSDRNTYMHNLICNSGSHVTLFNAGGQQCAWDYSVSPSVGLCDPTTAVGLTCVESPPPPPPPPAPASSSGSAGSGSQASTAGSQASTAGSQASTAGSSPVAAGPSGSMSSQTAPVDASSTQAASAGGNSAPSPAGPASPPSAGGSPPTGPAGPTGPSPSNSASTSSPPAPSSSASGSNPSPPPVQLFHEGRLIVNGTAWQTLIDTCTLREALATAATSDIASISSALTANTVVVRGVSATSSELTVYFAVDASVLSASALSNLMAQAIANGGSSTPAIAAYYNQVVTASAEVVAILSYSPLAAPATNLPSMTCDSGSANFCSPMIATVIAFGLAVLML